MKYMKIFNVAVLALVAGFLVIGPIALPFDEYLWRLLHLLVVLIIGFVFSTIGWVGAGDAKYAAAIAPFIAYADAVLILYLLAATMLAALVIHRICRRIGFVRRMTPDWVSWEKKGDFPAGLALSGVLIIYLLGSYFSV